MYLPISAIFRFVYPWAKYNALEHDSYSCGNFTNSHPFPTQRLMVPNNFVGGVYKFTQKFALKLVCPMECRPWNHQDWVYC